ncbi:S8 family serine peptidase [Fulvivirga sp. 29W222]|uniref:S8 family serine peptidase n=1 Tax=Fulvivirga marina TaxID=2494733 RepID=A0A937G0Q6_9BACT|nr:S8 family serine peptidase [Fulvivirga marina]MBL6447855.1 S8 family serine peptidase [Fulvivirga marina]
MRKFHLHIILILLLVLEAGAQQKYWIYFKDKMTTIAPSETDFYDHPLNKNYLDSLYSLDFHIIHQSKWLNAVSIITENHQIPLLQSLDFVDKIQAVNTQLKVHSHFSGTEADQVYALQQLNADTLIKLGLHGQGVKIGIIDGGFLDADKEETLSGLSKNFSSSSYHNFIEENVQNPFIGTRKYDDDHGTKVWKLIGGHGKASNKYYGLATKSTYYLARTDQGDKEYRGEEDYWIAALEWMHDQGVRLINSSLGYSTGYDNPKENYLPEDIDGSSAITQAATIAAREKNMILVIAAGNDGGNDFGVISIPADAEGILAVGATGFLHWKRQRYSSVGPEGLPYVKPEIACFSGRGTSFSAPVITGLIALVIQKYPGLNNKEVIETIKRASHLYPYPNNYLGYGVPDARKILHILNQQKVIQSHEEVSTSSNSIELDITGMNTVIFHKKDRTQVISQEIANPKRNKLVVQKADNAKFSTVASPEKVIEIKWL